MYYIRGKIQQTNSQDFIVLENNNIGYKIFTNEKGETNEENTFFVKIIINENELSYAGFKEQLELEVFEVLVSINGIGLKTALRILKHTNYKKIIYFCINDAHNELLKIPHINIENYLAVSTKIKKKFKNVKFEIKDVNGKKCELYKVLKSLGISENSYEKVAFLEEENLNLKDKLAKALKIINER